VSARVALATCEQLPALDADDRLLLEELRSRSIDAEPAIWDDPRIDWSSFDLVVLRSTWDYTGRLEQFLEWAQAVPRLLNSAAVVQWNTDKRYLAELPHAVETRFLDPGHSFEPLGAEYVVKPTVSAGSRDTARYGEHESDAAAAHVAQLQAAGRPVMIQPYLSSVDTHGETALIFFAGRYSHSIRKGQMLTPGTRANSDVLFIEENISPRQPEDDERAAADEILDSLRWPRTELLYARVDLIRAEDGRPRLVELELTEPSLFLSCDAAAASRLAEEIVRRL
jgi:glutathione synthase/RimK-type ligase-like ATP-grasp enzyme